MVSYWTAPPSTPVVAGNPTKINLLPPHITQVRVVEIEGLDMQADGGTHVSNTSEVGPLQIVDYESKGRMNKRLVVAVGAAKNIEGDGDV
mgnify:CR=1 FL=1